MSHERIHGTDSNVNHSNIEGEGKIMFSCKKWVLLFSVFSVVFLQCAAEEKTSLSDSQAEEVKRWQTPQNKWTGRFYFDGAAGNLNDESEEILGDFTSGTRFRTARLGVKGSLYDMIEYECELDFAGGKSRRKMYSSD